MHDENLADFSNLSDILSGSVFFHEGDSGIPRISPGCVPEMKSFICIVHIINF